MAILLQRPDDARARPSSLLKKDEDYAKVFSVDIPVDVYRVCAFIVKRVDAILRSNMILDASERNNLRFHIFMRVAAMAAGKKSPNAAEIAAIDVNSLCDHGIGLSVVAVKGLYDGLGGGDHVAKGSKLVEAVKNEVVDALS